MRLCIFALQKNYHSFLTGSLMLGLIIGLPWHGFFTVFAPDYWWWKELLLGVLALLAIPAYWQRWDVLTKILVLLCLWGGVLWLFSAEKMQALIALRYLLLGMIAWGIFRGNFRFLKDSNHLAWRKILAQGFLLSLGLSTLFGWYMLRVAIPAWEQGAENLASWYSATISSWVPGQTLPLYHLVGETPRLQGATSGPNALAVMLVMGLLILGTKKWSWGRFDLPFSAALSGLLFLSLWGTASRVGILLAVGLAFVWGSQQFFPRKIEWQKFWAELWDPANIWRRKKIFGLFGAAIASVLVIISNLDWDRAGTTEHFARPLATAEQITQAPLVGQLGTIGPAARWKNLQVSDNDQALIAENIFLDFGAQLGLPALGFLLLWGALLWRDLNFRGKTWLLLIALWGSTATLWDMTPVAILMAWGLAYWLKEIDQD